MSRGRIRFSRRVRRNAVAFLAITMILAVLLGIAYPIAKNASDKARYITLIVWGSLASISYLGYLIHAIYEYKTRSIDVEKITARKTKLSRRLILKQAKIICREEGRKLTRQERRDIESGIYDEKAFPRRMHE